MSARKKEPTRADRIKLIQKIIKQECLKRKVSYVYVMNQSSLPKMSTRERAVTNGEMRLARIEISIRLKHEAGLKLHQISRLLGVSEACVSDYLRMKDLPEDQRSRAYQKNKHLSYEPRTD